MPASNLERAGPPVRWPSGIAAILVLGLMLALRVWDLGIDPPRHVVEGYEAQAHFRDEVAKAHEARNQVLFGEWYLGEHDTYRFWRRQSPVWVWSQAAWLHAFGVGWVQARAFVVLHGLVALSLLFWLSLTRHGLPAAIASTLLLGLCWPFLVYSRLALMETAVVGYLMLTTLGLAMMERQPGRLRLWAPWTALAFLGACFTKQSGLLVLPGLAVSLLWIGGSAAREETADEVAEDRFARLRLGLGQPALRWSLAALALVAVVLVVQVLDPAYGSRLRFNARHFTHAGNDGSILAKAWSTFWGGLFGTRMWLILTALAPAPVMLALLEVGRAVGVAAARRREGGESRSGRMGALWSPLEPIGAWMGLWFLLALAASLASPSTAIRFQLFIVPPAAWLAGALVQRCWDHQWSREGSRRAAQLALSLCVAIPCGATLMEFSAWMRQSGHTAAVAGPDLESMIGDRDAVVVGEFAAQVTFETPYVHYYVRRELGSGTREVLDAMEITHVVFERRGDFVRERVQKVHPELLIGRRRLGTILYMDRELTVYELAPPRRRARLWAARKRRLEERRAENKQPKKKPKAKRTRPKTMPEQPGRSSRPRAGR